MTTSRTSLARRLATLLRLDAKLALRHHLLTVVVVVALAFGLLIRFALPDTLALADDSLAALELPEAPQPTVLDPHAQKPPFDESFLPVLFAVDLCLLGFMFGAVMVLQDRQSGVIRAYRVGPAGALEYLLSKLGINLGLSLLNLLVLVGIAAPRHLGEPLLYLLVLLICAGMTLLGMGLAVFFRGLAQFFFPLIAVGLIAALPMYLMFTPSAALDWTIWLPTYHVLFGGEAIMFAGEREVVDYALTYALAFTTLTALFCGLACSRRLLREVSK